MSVMWTTDLPLKRQLLGRKRTCLTLGARIDKCMTTTPSVPAIWSSPIVTPSTGGHHDVNKHDLTSNRILEGQHSRAGPQRTAPGGAAPRHRGVWSPRRVRGQILVPGCAD